MLYQNIRYNKGFLKKLEQDVGQTGYQLRYGKGSFKYGACILREKKVLVINRFCALEAKIDILLQFLQPK